MSIYRFIYSILAGLVLGWILRPIMPNANTLQAVTFIILGATLLQVFYVWALEPLEPKNRKNNGTEE